MILRTVKMLVVFILLTGLTQAQLNFNLNGSGARFAGMGYAATGLADDATAISWNPAGLTQLYKMEGSVVGRLAFGSATLEGFNDIGIDSWDIEQNSNFQLNFASFAVPFSAGNFNMVGGVAYRRVFDFNQDQTETITGSAVAFLFPPANMEYKLNSVFEGGIDAVSPSIGFQLNEMVSVGVTANIFFGSLTRGGSETFDGMEDVFNDNTIDFSGTAFDVGLMVKPNNAFQLGANLNLPHTITETLSSDMLTNDVELELEIPFFFSVGAAFRASDVLTLAFDYRSRPWSSAKEAGLEFTDQDANSIHAGLEYLIESGDSFFPVRLGFFTAPQLDTDNDDNQIVNNGFTAGFGIVMESIVIDSAVEWVTSSYALSDNVDWSGNDIRLSFGAVLHLDK